MADPSGNSPATGGLFGDLARLFGKGGGSDAAPDTGPVTAPAGVETFNPAGGGPVGGSLAGIGSDQLSQAFENAPLAIVFADRAGRVLAGNRMFCELAGLDSVSPQAGLALSDLVMAEDAGLLAEATGQALAGSPPGHPVELRMARDPELVAAGFVRALQCPDETAEEAESAPSLILHLIDVSQRKKLEAQFVQSQKMQAVGQLAGGVAHDFNNLLTAMIGFCDLLLLRHSPGDQSFADIMQIKQNANRAANLVRQLLAFSRQQTLRPRVLDVSEVLSELSHLLRRLMGENIRLDMRHGRNLDLVKADQGQIEQVILNLAVNARDAMPEGGALSIATETIEIIRAQQIGSEEILPGRYVKIEVADTGTGIPPEVVPRIFEPFFTTKAVGSGTGLGLSTVYGIVKQTGGHVLVNSEVGEGTSFSILLPAYAADAAQGAEPGEEAEARNRDLTGAGTIMLVEDEDPVRLFSARALRNKGYKVIEARSGEAAMEILAAEEEPIDLLITDVVMPGIDGPTLIRLVRERRPHIKVLCISGYSEDALRQRIAEETGIAFLSKPFSLKQLAGRVKELLDG
ncbi:ATP-binding protein [Oceanibaculum indicum]|uniref:histidine kinase n=1 Tax=Oceanibaculum indicum P24 TaxID=1207063 RepID=K2JXJ8_9PROT|nr:ATP-binding protein [Oceanibaculum indicum]EKE75034.1 Hybrid sensor histidine kinase [Oceanibaculum indicum P24]